MEETKKKFEIQNNKFHTILLINDDDEFTNKLNKYLSKKYNIFIAKNGFEAIKKIKKIQKLELIISNIEMPVMDGYFFLEELSKIENYFLIPFIFILPNSSKNITIKNEEGGIIDYIIRPFKNSELETKIEALIHKEYDI